MLAVAKTNIGRVPVSLAYRMVPAEDDFDTVRVRWDGTSKLTADQLVREQMTGEDRSAVHEAEVFLTELLGSGPVAATDATRQAVEEGISESAALRRAKQRLRVRSRKTATGAWVWELPGKDEQQPAKGRRRPERPRLAPVAPLALLRNTPAHPTTEASREGSPKPGQGEQGSGFRAAYPSPKRRP